MRTGPAVALGCVVGTALAALVASGFLRLWAPAGTSSSQTPMAATTEHPFVDRVGMPAVPATSSTTPTRPWYGPGVEEPGPIYRCKADGRTTFRTSPVPAAT